MHVGYQWRIFYLVVLLITSAMDWSASFIIASINFAFLSCFSSLTAWSYKTLPVPPALAVLFFFLAFCFTECWCILSMSFNRAISPPWDEVLLFMDVLMFNALKYCCSLLGEGDRAMYRVFVLLLECSALCFWCLFLMYLFLDKLFQGSTQTPATLCTCQCDSILHGIHVCVEDWYKKYCRCGTRVHTCTKEFNFFILVFYEVVYM